MSKIFKKTDFLAILLGSLTVIGSANGYKFAVVNDIHADINYVPTSPNCISKAVNP